MRSETQAAANLAILQRYAKAWLAGDGKTVLESYHADMTLYYGGANPLSGVHAGKPAALNALREIARRANRQVLEIVDLMAGPVRACMIVRERFTRGDETDDVEHTMIYSFKDGQLFECWVHDQDQALIDRYLRD